MGRVVVCLLLACGISRSDGWLDAMLPTAPTVSGPSSGLRSPNGLYLAITATSTGAATSASQLLVSIDNAPYRTIRTEISRGQPDAFSVRLTPVAWSQDSRYLVVERSREGQAKHVVDVLLYDVRTGEMTFPDIASVMGSTDNVAVQSVIGINSHNEVVLSVSGTKVRNARWLWNLNTQQARPEQ